jgi:hypothetical protein
MATVTWYFESYTLQVFSVIRSRQIQGEYHDREKIIYFYIPVYFIIHKYREGMLHVSTQARNFINGSATNSFSIRAIQDVWKRDLQLTTNAPSFIWDSYGSMWLSLVMQDVSKRALQWYSNCYFVTCVERWTDFTPLRVNGFVTLAIQ